MDEEEHNYTFTESVPKGKVTMGNLKKEYTYENNQLIIKNVTDDLNITSFIPLPFKDDDWNTIKENIDTGKYNVGDEKQVTLEGLGTYTLRVVNTSTPPEESI